VVAAKIRQRPLQAAVCKRRSYAPLLLVVVLLGGSSATWAQSDRAATNDALKQRDQELQAVRAEQRKAAETEMQLRQEVDALGDDRRKLNQSLIDSAARVRVIEQQMVETEARLSPMTDRELSLRKSLESRRTLIAEVLAALQRMGRRPPPALLIQPEDALESVRTAVVLGAVLPGMRAEAQALARDLGDLVQLRKDIAEQRKQLTQDLADISKNRERITLLLEQRKKQQGDAQKALETERQYAAQLSRQADNLKDLIAKLEQNLDSATRNARVAARAAEEGKQLGGTRSDLSALRDPGRLAPAVAFATARGSLPMPVNGIRVREYGTPDSAGGTEKGVSVTTRAGAQVTAPCDGWVVYAAPYRSYGQLLILNAGGGYHILLAGMERISVDLGQFVLTGEPVGIMGNHAGSDSGMQATSPLGSSQPVLYIEFRKDGTPIDPSPWWAPPDNEKVRG